MSKPDFTCDECPAPIDGGDLDALIADSEGRLERVLCPRCRDRLGFPALVEAA